MSDMKEETPFNYDEDENEGAPVDVAAIRARNVADIKMLYGTESDIGRELMLQVLCKYALDLLPNAAIAELAELHRFTERKAFRSYD